MLDFDFDLPSKEVKVPHSANPLRVRGLDFNSLVILFREYASEIDILFQKFSEAGSPDKSLDMDGVRDMGMGMVEMAPELAARIIMLAADAPDNPEMRSKFLRLPFPVQLEALEAVALLTFDGEDGPKKAVEAVIRALRVSRGQIQNLSLRPRGT